MAIPSTAVKAEQDPASVARLIVDVASDKQATDILMLDIREVASYADYLVIMSAGSVRQMASLAGDLHQTVKKDKLPLHHWEGSADSGWLLLDCIDVVVHVFSEEQRAFYQLEQVWSRAKMVVRVQ